MFQFDGGVLCDQASLHVQAAEFPLRLLPETKTKACLLFLGEQTNRHNHFY